MDGCELCLTGASKMNTGGGNPLHRTTCVPKKVRERKPQHRLHDSEGVEVESAPKS